MKLTFVLIMAAMLNASASVYSQTVNFSGRNVKLKSVFTAIRKQTGYVVFYDNQLIKAARPVTVSMQHASVDALLSAALEGQGLTYSITDKTISIRKQTINARKIPDLVFFPPPPVVISGKVTDDAGEPLPGVTIMVQGTTKGTTTDDKGEFRLSNVDDNATLVFTYIGFEKYSVTLSGQKNLQVKLTKALDTALEGVVVVGYGSMKKADLTGAVSAVQGEAITERKTAQISTALQGTMPGVMVTRSSSAPGATANIRIRGITTIGGEGINPLIILDGVPIDDINTINPNDVESISVLKDAASASIYGSRAAAGVIVVTSKRAKGNQLSMDYAYEYGIEKATKLPDYVDVVRYMQLTNELRWNDNGNNANEYPTYPKATVDNYLQLHAENPDEYPNTDWRGLMLNSYAPRQSHILGINAAGKNVRSKVSLGYDDLGALYDGRTYKRLTARLNNDIVINKYLTATADINFRRTNIDQPVVVPFYKMSIMPALYAAEWSDGRIGAGKDGANIYAQMKHGGFSKEWYNQLGGKLGVDFTPIDGLKLSGVVSPFLNFDKTKNFRRKIEYTSWSNPNSPAGYIQDAPETRLNEERNDSYRYTVQFLANYAKQLGGHNINLLGGYEYFKAFNENLGASRGQYVLTSYPYLNLGPLEFRDNSGSAWENAYRSWFGRVMYNYRDKYLLQANIRYDASSRFAPGYRWGAFPSVSAGWVVSQESFMKRAAPWLSFFKVRASWGTLGNERIGNYPYQSILSFENNSLFYQGNTVVSAQSAAQWQYVIRDISWETTASTDIGIDVNVLDNRLRFTGDYFKKTTSDMLLELEIPDFIGFDNPDQNTGKMYTTGWEMMVSWNDKVGDFNYSVSANLSDFRSRMGDLGGTEFLGDQIKKQGSEFNEWYGYISDGLFQTQEDVDKFPKTNANVRPGDVRYRDISGPNGVPDGKISPEYDRVLLGGSLPRYMYGATLQAGYKNWNLGVVLQGVGKQNARLSADIVRPLMENYGGFPVIIDGNSWSKYNTPEQNLRAKYPRYSNTSVGNNYVLSDYWLINGGYFRLKNINLAYNLPKNLVQKARVQGIRLYATVTDLLSVHNFPKGWDPEQNSLGYPITVTYLVGASVKF
ncbi:TonB-dependent receptor [Chitinophaga sp.]|uniref:TonB-dependent receptor n=1 Tax=Chitinophaga sp. TaxID=1869181 RepID=UPI0031D64875